MKVVVAITGASGALYAQRLIACLIEAKVEIDVVLSMHAKEVAGVEKVSYDFPKSIKVYGDRSMQKPFVSGSAQYDAMVVIPCSMGTVGRIAHGYSDSAITRAADVFLKEKRPLILVPRETPWNLIQARNIVSVMEAGATVIPASPSFYGNPTTVVALVDTIVARVLDHLKVRHQLVKRWKQVESPE
ncbi:MAG: UbiX family flavin prenyltransferase [Verrucomicrobiota bacterium]